MIRRPGVWLLAPVLAVAVVAAGLTWFVGVSYPAMGLAGVSQAGYRQALDRVARSRAAIDGRTFAGFDSMTYRPGDTGGAAHAWGVARSRTAGGTTELYWVSLRWSPRDGQWLRVRVQELVPPGNELYFDRQYPSQVLRAQLALREILGGLWSQLREAGHTTASDPGLPTPGL